MAAKKGKSSKAMGKKDLKRTKGGLLPAVNVNLVGDKKLNFNPDLGQKWEITGNTIGS